jgi:O-antigen/teichoic acid export membrane protein
MSIAITAGCDTRTTASTEALALRRNFSWTLVGSLVYAACQWAMLVVLAKLGSPHMVGQFALALAITTPVILLANLNLRVLQATDVTREYLFREYVAVRLLMLLLAVVVIAGITMASQYDSQAALIIVMVSVAKVFDSLSDVIYGRLQLHEQMDRIATSRIIQGVLQLAALGIIVRQTGSLLWATAAMAISSGFVTVLYDVPSVRLVQQRGRPTVLHELSNAHLQSHWQAARLWKLVCMAFPLGIVAGLHTLNANVPRFFVDREMGAGALGSFAAMWYIVPTGGLVLGAMVQSASPRLARHFHDDIGKYKRLLLGLIALAAANGVVGVLAALWFGRSILTVLYKAEYAQYPSAFVWIMVSAGLAHVAWALAGGVSAARYFSVQIPVYMTATVATTLACAWLIPRYQMNGAAWALCVGTALCVVGFGGITLQAVRMRDRQGPTL